MFIGTLQPASNSADWSGDGQLIDDETGDAISLSAVSEITIIIRDPQSRAQMLSATYTGGDITLTDASTKLSWTFSAGDMGGLDAKTYDIGCTVEQASQTIQIIIGKLPVLDGIVT